MTRETEERRKKARNKKRRSKIKKAVTVLVILAVAAGAGFSVWHFTSETKRESNNTASTEKSGSVSSGNEASEGKESKDSKVSAEAAQVQSLAGIEKGRWAVTDYVKHAPVETDNTVVLKSSRFCPKNRTLTVKNMAGYTPLNLKPVKGSYNDKHGIQKNPTVNRQFTSIYMILFSLKDDTVVAERDPDKVINPASMTKILTVLTAADLVKNMNGTVRITQDILNYVSANGASAVGFRKGDRIKVRDLFYGTILPSGADAAIALAKYCAGDEKTFVKAMNEKASELGLGKTAHFTNMTGIYNKNHHCTVRDMAVILSAAVQNPFVKKVLSAHTRTIRAVNRKKHIYGVSNLFLRRIEDHESGGTVVAAKTGFVNQSGCCAASYYTSDSGNEYICVTDNTYSSWRAIYDHVAAYRNFAQN